MTNPIYKPKGAAAEYGDWALNIYTGCPHRCSYCYAPAALRRDKETFHSVVEPRKGIIAATKEQLERGSIPKEATVFLCFACDPYPIDYDTTPTREIIKLLKEYGNHVQILTKGDGSRDFDLLGGGDWYGVTIDGADTKERYSDYDDCMRLADLSDAKQCGIKTWVSFEPVLDTNYVLQFISDNCGIFDKIKIGKLNHRRSDIDWKKFGQQAERLCKSLGIDYYIKESLRKEMEK